MASSRLGTVRRLGRPHHRHKGDPSLHCALQLYETSLSRASEAIEYEWRCSVDHGEETCTEEVEAFEREGTRGEAPPQEGPIDVEILEDQGRRLIFGLGWLARGRTCARCPEKPKEPEFLRHQCEQCGMVQNVKKPRRAKYTMACEPRLPACRELPLRPSCSCCSWFSQDVSIKRWRTLDCSLRPRPPCATPDDDALIEAFESSAGIEVEYVAVGTGATLELGREGDVDMVIVHAPDREQVFLDSGSGSNRTTFAWNRFVLLISDTPPLDANLTETMRKIVEDDACFISRGDDSGTHTKEQAIWTAVGENHGMSMVEDDLGLHPSWPGYLPPDRGWRRP